VDNGKVTSDVALESIRTVTAVDSKATLKMASEMALESSIGEMATNLKEHGFRIAEEE
jgi:hypothetical protein